MSTHIRQDRFRPKNPIKKSQGVIHQLCGPNCTQIVNSKKEAIFEYPLSNFGSFSYFQTSLSLGVEQGLQKLQKFDINDLRLLFHCNILIPRKCPRKTPFKAQCPPYRDNIVYGRPLRVLAYF